MARQVNWRLVKSHRNYEVAELAKLIGVCRGTIRNWIKRGLPVLSEGRPYLIVGGDFKGWYQHQKNERRQKCKPGEMFCLRCRAPKSPALGMVDFVQRAPMIGNLVGLCERCGATMNRACKQSEITNVMPGVDVTIHGGGDDIKGYSRAFPELTLEKGSVSHAQTQRKQRAYQA